MVTLREIMTRDVATVPPEASVRDAIELLAGRHISGAPVVVGERVVGVVSTTDLLGFAAALPGVPADHTDQLELGDSEPAMEWEDGADPPSAYFSELWSDAGAELEERFQETASAEWDPLVEHTVAEVMTRHVCSLPPGATVVAAAEYMARAGVHRVLVMDGARLVGIVSTHDIVRAVAARRLADRTAVFNRDGAFDERGWPMPYVPRRRRTPRQ
jgi:CBS domain-containing protein